MVINGYQKKAIYMSLVFQVKSYNHIKLLQFKILESLKSVISIYYVKSRKLKLNIQMIS